MDSKKELANLLFWQREHERYHKTYEEELKFYKLVENGDIDSIRKFPVLYVKNDYKDYGKLSDDPLRNLTYHFVVLSAMLTRVCIEGGMPYETAYTLSDLYIRTADKAKNINEIQAIHKKMILDYTMRMQKIHKENSYSKTVVLCLDYIEHHLHEHITVSALAVFTKKNPTYLSKLFKKETGKPVSRFITERKLEEIKNLLCYDSIPFSEIASDFAFSSQSHFTNVFKTYTGYTPKQFQKKYFRTNFLDS